MPWNALRPARPLSALTSPDLSARAGPWTLEERADGAASLLSQPFPTFHEAGANAALAGGLAAYTYAIRYSEALLAIPVVAIAPLLVIWLGDGILSKVIICALIVFFPVLVNTIVGIRAVPPALYDLMRTIRATRWQILLKLEVPAALLTLPAPGAIDEDAAHGLGGDSNELRAVLPLLLGFLDQPQVGLVHQRRCL